MKAGQVDGVPVRWAAGPGPFAAGLVFGVGRRDETFLRGGLTHLVEHLAMGAVGRTTLECNATVDLISTEFTATGRPERVVDFLRRICDALRDLPLDRLAVEVGVLRTEDGVVAAPAVGALLAEQYGSRGAGLAGYRDPALLSLSPDDVRDWAGTRFVRGAAALWLSGPPPAGLSLPLTDREPPPRPVPQLRRLTTPALVEHPVGGAVVLGADLSRLRGLGPAGRILRDRVEDDLRHRRGLSYMVAIDLLQVDADRQFLAVTADCRDGEEAVAARALWQGLTRLADEGPTDEELTHERNGVADYLDDARFPVEQARLAAVASVTDLPSPSSPALLREEALTLSAQTVQEVARAVRTAMLLGVPVGVDPALPTLTPVTGWSADVVAGVPFPRRRRGSAAPRGARLVVGEDGTSVVLADGEQLTVRYADAVALLQLGDHEWSLVGGDGTAVPLDPADWRGGDAAVARVRAAVPQELQAPIDMTRPSTRRVLLLHAPRHAVFEALGASRVDAWVLHTGAWALVVRHEDEFEAYADAAGVSAVLGRKHAVVLLDQDHGELRMVLMHRGKETDRHIWTGAPHDPAQLSAVLGADREQIAALLAHPGRPQEVLAALTDALGIPPQTSAVLSGAPFEEVHGLVREGARGVRENIAAAVRGEFDPPDSKALQHRLLRWERERPAGYRVVNGVAAVGQAAVGTVLLTWVDGDWASWTGALAVLFVVGAAGSLRSARPPSRGQPRPGVQLRDDVDRAPGA